MNGTATDFLYNIYGYLDQGLIFFYRLFDNPTVGYLFGTCMLAIFCAAAGRLTAAAATKINGTRLSADNREMIRMHNLSLQALAAGDKNAFQACNREANAAFGQYFFGTTARSMSVLWPVPFALAWLDTRFAGIEFMLPVNLPGIGTSVGYPFTFIPIYILARILLACLLPRKNSAEKNQMKMLSLSDVIRFRT